MSASTPVDRASPLADLMREPTFTILMPVVRPPVLLPFAIASVQAQTRDDFELFIICDGAPDATVTAAREAERADDRIRAFVFPKGERRGEAHRHTALEHARGRLICQLADDDLWLPEHLEQMAQHLAEVEFGNLPHVSISPVFGSFLPLFDLSDLSIQARMTGGPEIFNMFGPSQAGYRMETYRRLPVGWSPAPPGIPTDLFMWRKFLALPDIRVGTRFVVTSIHVGDAARAGWDLERRREEVADLVQLLARPDGRQRLWELALQGTARHEAVQLDARDHDLQQARNWQDAHRQAFAELEATRAYVAQLEAAPGPGASAAWSQGTSAMRGILHRVGRRVRGASARLSARLARRGRP